MFLKSLLIFFVMWAAITLAVGLGLGPVWGADYAEAFGGVVGAIAAFGVARWWYRRSKGRPRIPKGMPKDVVYGLFDQVIDEMVAGEHASKTSSNLMLKQDEHLIIAIPNIQLCEERAVGGKYQTAGVSFRVAKGVTFRTGSIERKPIETEVVPIDSGTLTLTNKRLVFSGEKQNRENLLKKLLTLEPLADGIAISRTGRQRTQYYVGTDQVTVRLDVTPDGGDTFKPGRVDWTLNGEEFQMLVQRAARDA